MGQPAHNKKRTTRSKKKKNNNDDDFEFEPNAVSSEEMTPDADDDFSHDKKTDRVTTTKRTRKRKGKSASTDLNDYGNSVVLSREHLLTISSSEYDSLVQKVSREKSLTDEELKEVRRQKRLI